MKIKIFLFFCLMILLITSVRAECTQTLAKECVDSYDENGYITKTSCPGGYYEEYKRDSEWILRSVITPFLEINYERYNDFGYPVEISISYTGFDIPPYVIYYDFDKDGFLVEKRTPGEISRYTKTENLIKKVSKYPNNIITNSWQYEDGKVICENCQEDDNGLPVGYRYDSQYKLVSERQFDDDISASQTYYQNTPDVDKFCWRYCEEETCGEKCSAIAYGSPVQNITGELYGENLTYNYDDKGNLIYDPIFNISYEYDELGRVISDGVYLYEYNLEDKIESQIDIASDIVVATFSYNRLGLISEINYYDGSKYEYFYDLSGNLLMANISGQIIIYLEPGNMESAVTLEELKYMIENPVLEAVTLRDVLAVIQKWMNGEESLWKVISTIGEWRKYRASLR